MLPDVAEGLVHLKATKTLLATCFTTAKLCEETVRMAEANIEQVESTLGAVEMANIVIWSVDLALRQAQASPEPGVAIAGAAATLFHLLKQDATGGIAAAQALEEQAEAGEGLRTLLQGVAAGSRTQGSKEAVIAYFRARTLEEGTEQAMGIRVRGQ